MIVQVQRLLLLFWIFYFPFQSVFSQQSSRNNYTGAWETPASWDQTWAVPLSTKLSGYNITISGYITLNSSLSFSGTASNIVINDTLVIKGDLLLENNTQITINDNGILIVRGNLMLSNQSTIIANGYLIVAGDIIKNGSYLQGPFTSKDNPVKLFVGGKISPVELTYNYPKFPVLNCTTPTTTTYTNSNCSYGNMTDIKSDPIYSFFQSTCIIATPTIIAGVPTTFCAGGSVTLTSSAGISYLWSNAATTASINVTTAESYTVQVTNASGCQSAVSAARIVTVNELPVAKASNNGPVYSVNALNLIGGPEGMKTYSWTGPGGFTSNSQSPSVSASAIAAMAGVYSLTVTNTSGCTNTATTTVEVNELPVPSVITPNGDGDNDYFVIGEIIHKVELIIFNRWGNEEYSNSNYSNNWDGRNNKGVPLPNDTYFYILKFESGIIKKGSVLIKR